LAKTLQRGMLSALERAERLQDHLDIHTAYNNGYDLS
jgi:hypothetical protein